MCRGLDHMLFEEDFLMDYECIQSGKYSFVQQQKKESNLKQNKLHVLAKRFNKLTVEMKGSELVKNKKRSYVFMTWVSLEQKYL